MLFSAAVMRCLFSLKSADVQYCKLRKISCMYIMMVMMNVYVYVYVYV